MKTKQLQRQLSGWIGSTEEQIVDRFASLPNAIRLPVPGELDAVFVPATRPGPAVLLVAHFDTVWDYPGKVQWNGHIGESYWNGMGIGADDRAGIAALWSLRRSGHAMLIVPAEERGCIGSRYVSDEYPDILTSDRLAFALQFDRRGNSDLVFYNGEPGGLLPILQRDFGGYYQASGSYSDITEICPALGIAGANISIGFDDEHTSYESIDLAAWFRTVENTRRLLTRDDLDFIPYVEKPFPKYRKASGTTTKSKTLPFDQEWLKGLDDYQTGLDSDDDDGGIDGGFPVPDNFTLWCDDCSLEWEPDEVNESDIDGVLQCPVCTGPTYELQPKAKA